MQCWNLTQSSPWLPSARGQAIVRMSDIIHIGLALAHGPTGVSDALKATHQAPPQALEDHDHSMHVILLSLHQDHGDANPKNEGSSIQWSPWQARHCLDFGVNGVIDRLDAMEALLCNPLKHDVEESVIEQYSQDITKFIVAIRVNPDPSHPMQPIFKKVTIGYDLPSLCSQVLTMYYLGSATKSMILHLELWCGDPHPRCSHVHHVINLGDQIEPKVHLVASVREPVGCHVFSGQ